MSSRYVLFLIWNIIHKMIERSLFFLLNFMDTSSFFDSINYIINNSQVLTQLSNKNLNS
jgi:hypothetical protein